jgi:hypothetical protein
VDHAVGGLHVGLNDDSVLHGHESAGTRQCHRSTVDGLGAAVLNVRGHDLARQDMEGQYVLEKYLVTRKRLQRGCRYRFERLVAGRKNGVGAAAAQRLVQTGFRD